MFVYVYIPSFHSSFILLQLVKIVPNDTRKWLAKIMMFVGLSRILVLQIS